MTRVLSELDFLTDPFEWSLDRYHSAIEAGVLTEYDAVELIHGQLVKKMPISEDHAGTVEELADFFRDLFGKNYRYRSENPVPVLPKSEPEPDFVIAKRKTGKKTHPTPEEIYLIVEVANSTLQYDRKVKGPIYAGAGIPEYWIINLKARKIEVHLSPVREDSIFDSVTSYGESETFKSPFAGQVVVKDLLPKGDKED
ncbi:Uma2 family endonuclease [Neolewinella antarctica]|uniref:Uma2 family endonuclease n=1 Tax=Neolewinella antarctica TaxID=442734 RepID=A0ABX0XEZ8_9BACT|nr:Uma2 family endonuclease [Neolewinella antarctica]NJC27484.1 Uma2 family endonuclease [Neolewinella antarctica]